MSIVLDSGQGHGASTGSDAGWGGRAVRCGAQVLLQPPVAVLRGRLAARWAEGRHFMPPSQLDAQLAALEVRLT